MSQYKPAIISLLVIALIFIGIYFMGKSQGIKKGVVKDINLGLFIGQADLERMEKRSKEFLSEGHQVRINLLLRGRENAKRDMAFALVNKFIVSLGEVNISKEPKLEGKILRAVVAKKK